ncbi:MAG TPA: hypothetical protein VGO21_03045, partial [Candidatus Paceibacterota bacterium]|nr:hypothetical protein [Candidatus Paceibacterota bacterium]
MKRILILNKKEGETPLEALENFRNKNKKYKNVKMTYAGRLDPLVSGLLLVLVGDAVKEKEKYIKLSKEYTFSVLFGFATDTYDILGKVVSGMQYGAGSFHKEKLEEKIKKSLKFFTGKFIQAYPMYSSRTVGGKPLFTYARLGKKVKVPVHEVEVKNLKFHGITTIRSKDFLRNIDRRIKKVTGDFRQREILNIWHNELEKKNQEKFFIANFQIKCSSGTYVRGIANSLGE